MNSSVYYNLLVSFTFIILIYYSATMKAVDAAIHSRQWNKAVQILEVVEDTSTSAKYYKKIALHYANIGEYDVCTRLE